MVPDSPIPDQLTSQCEVAVMVYSPCFWYPDWRPHTTGVVGSIVAGSLEQSNVEVTEQFVELIAHQRSFQANSKTITTADQMLQELMNISR